MKAKDHFRLHLLKNSAAFIILMLFFSCKETKETDADSDQFNYAVFSKHDTIIEYIKEIDLKLNNHKLSYHVSHRVNLETYNDSVLSSNFILNGVKFQTPKKFRNKPEYNYLYSSFPEYKSGTYNYIKTFFRNGKYYVLLQSINPFCHGTNCQSNYLHLLIIEKIRILLNSVYYFNDSEEMNFENAAIEFSSSGILLMNGDELIEKI